MYCCEFACCRPNQIGGAHYLTRCGRLLSACSWCLSNAAKPGTPTYLLVVAWNAGPSRIVWLTPKHLQTQTMTVPIDYYYRKPGSSWSRAFFQTHYVASDCLIYHNFIQRHWHWLMIATRRVGWCFQGLRTARGRRNPSKRKKTRKVLSLKALQFVEFG